VKCGGKERRDDGLIREIEHVIPPRVPSRGIPDTREETPI